MSALQRVVRLSSRSFRLFSSTAVSRADPWPLPHTPEHMANTTTPADLAPPAPLPRLNESIDVMRARLVYQSRKRGTLESDLLLSTFARDNLSTMSETELKEYDKVSPSPLSPIRHVHISYRCSTSRTGIYTTGRRENVRRLSVGRTLPFLRS